MRKGSGELVATDGPTVLAKPFLDSIVVEDSQRDGRFADPSGTDGSDWFKVFSEADNRFDQLVTPKTGPWWLGWGFSECAGHAHQVLGLLIV